ncbi:MAG TPA: hypothetical protein P5138_03675 [Solirubrobacterales bacterium]|nr:hypothetical protein [Solirubrobacterales bacterium]HRV59702.1 hypothetical protein [Solirubrobacterales bacterium]
MGTKRGQIQIACLLGSLILFSGLALVLKGPAPTSTEPALAKAAPDARASAGQRLGKAMWGPAEVNGVSQFPTYKDLGVGIYQMAIDWSQIAATRPATATDPADPAYQWPEHFEKTILEANRYGMQVTMMVIGAPAWANGGHSDRAWTPKNPKDYADFVTAMSRKYPRVRFWMIWGEPNRSPNFKPLTPSRTGPLNAAQARAPRNYARILDAAYVALKNVDSRDLVIGGNTFTAAGRDSISTYQWIRYMRLPNGGRPRMDLYGHNPFGFRIPSLANKPSPRGMVDFSDSKRLTKVLDRYYPRKRFRLFLSEWGVPAGATEDTELGYKLNYATQARWIKAGLRLSRKFKRIYTIGWIHPYDRPELGIITGLLKADGRKKPGYFSFRNG